MTGEWSNHLWQSTLFAIPAGFLTILFRGNRAQVRYWLWFSASFKFPGLFSLLTTQGSHLIRMPAQPEIAAPVLYNAASPAAMLGIWACGFAGVVPMRLRGWARVRDALRASIPIDIPAPVEIRSSPGLLEPGVTGLFHSRLLVPAGIVENLTPQQLEAVLAHELCHVRRRDNLTSAIHMLVEAIFWFHPLVWWIGTRLVQERERACDEEVLRLGEPRTCAEGIVKVCKSYLESPLSCVSGVTGSDLRKRIQAILTARIPSDLNLARKAVLATAGIAALATPLIVGAINAPVLRAQTQSEPFRSGITPKFDVSYFGACRGAEPSPGGRGGTGGRP